MTGLRISEAAGVVKPMLSPTAALVSAEPQRDPFGRETPLSPLFRADGGSCLATYSGTDVPAAAAREQDGWRSFYFASAPLPSWVLRQVVKSAGCHQYATNDDVVYAGRSHLVVHTNQPGTHVLRLPQPKTIVDAVTSQVVARATSLVELKCDGAATWILEVSRPSGKPGSAG